MENIELANALKVLLRDGKSRSETARLRDVFGDIETAMTAGVSRKAIVGKLKEHGFTMTLKSFESAVYRIRKSQREGQVMVAGQHQQLVISAFQPTPEVKESIKWADDQKRYVTRGDRIKNKALAYQEAMRLEEEIYGNNYEE